MADMSLIEDLRRLFEGWLRVMLADEFEHITRRVSYDYKANEFHISLTLDRRLLAQVKLNERQYLDGETSFRKIRGVAHAAKDRSIYSRYMDRHMAEHLLRLARQVLGDMRNEWRKDGANPLNLLGLRVRLQEIRNEEYALLVRKGGGDVRAFTIGKYDDCIVGMDGVIKKIFHTGIKTALSSFMSDHWIDAKTVSAYTGNTAWGSF